MIQLKVIISMFLLIPTITFSQTTKWIVFDTTNSSLPSNYVTSIASDNYGYKWIGTYNGLVRISDYNWVIYNSSNSGLMSDWIECIAIDHNNIKWIGTAGHGLIKYDDYNWTLFTSQNSLLSSNYVSDIYIDGQNKVWVCTQTGYGAGGVAVINDTSWTVYTEYNSNIPCGFVSSIFVDSVFTAWIGMNLVLTSPPSPVIMGGVVKFDGLHWLPLNTQNSGLCSDDVLCINHSNNIIWIGTSFGLSKYDGINWTTYDWTNVVLPDYSFNCISIDSNHNKWFGVGEYNRDNALVHFDDINWTIFDTTNSALPDGQVSSILIDLHSNKWIGVRSYWKNYKQIGGGLAIYNEGGIVSIKSGSTSDITNGYVLKNNYPNPFNAKTTIEYKIPNKSHVRVSIYNIIGDEIGEIVNEIQVAGEYKIHFDGKNFSSGIYYYRLITNKQIITKKLLLIK